MTIEVRQMVIKSEVEDGAERAVSAGGGEVRDEAAHAPAETSSGVSAAAMRAILDRLDRMRER
ncbi:MAG: hypothetical protein JO142_19355 [Burkholderiales bacterium]|nr:hypothetical protein [Burkholderiales bacterium]